MIYDILPVILNVVAAVVASVFLAPILGWWFLCDCFSAIAVYINNIIRDDLKRSMISNMKPAEAWRDFEEYKFGGGQRQRKEVINEYDDQWKSLLISQKFVEIHYFSHARSLFSNLTKFAVMAIGIYSRLPEVYTLVLW